VSLLSANADLFRRPPSRLRNWLLPAAITLLAVMMWPRADRFDSTRQHYGYDWPGDLSSTIRMAAVEIVVLYGILRPWSYDRSWRRAAVAWLVLLPWSVLLFAVIMHAGPTRAGHTLWLTLVETSLFITTLVSLGARWRDARRMYPRRS
jgi:hypothetical protein